MTFIDPGEIFVKTFGKIETENDVFAYVDLAWYQTQNQLKFKDWGFYT